MEFRTETVLVQVPVTVTDKSGKHIHGLAREDFQVLENGNPQKIANFEEIVASHSALPAPAVHDGVFSNIDPVPDKAHTAVVIALDTINTPYMDQAYGRKEMIKYLATHVEAGQPIGLVQINGKGLRVIHTLTSDPTVLVEALKKVNGEIPALQGVDIDAQAAATVGVDPSNTPLSTVSLMSMGTEGVSETTAQLLSFIANGDATIVRMQQDHAIEITLRAFLDIATALSGIPGRKAVLWATGSFPFAMDSYSAVPGGYLTGLYEHVIQALDDADISVYPVDVRGLVNTSPAGDATYSGSLTGPAMSRAATARGWLQNSTLDTLRQFAEMTGGRAYYNNNDVEGGFRKAVDDASEYYMLSYYLDTKNTKAGWRKLSVKVQKSGAEVRARVGFFVTSATTSPSANRQLDVESALASPFDDTGIPMTVKWMGNNADGEKRKVDFSIHMAGGSILIEEPRNNHFKVEFDAVAYNKEGASAGTFGQVMEGGIKPESLASVKETGLGYHNSLELAPGQYTVRFVVRDNLTGKLGSVTAPLTVN